MRMHLASRRRDQARERAINAEKRADKCNAERALAVEQANSLLSKVAALEATATANVDTKLMYEERLHRETSALRSHVEAAEARCREAERRRDGLAAAIDAERENALRAKTVLARAEERVMEEQVRSAVAEERWGPLLRQRDEAQRERARAARALSAMHAEKRELEWAVSDLGRRSLASGTPLRAWEPAFGVSSSPAGGGQRFVSSPYSAHGSTLRTAPLNHDPGYGEQDRFGASAAAAAAVAAARAVSPVAGLAAEAAAARVSSPVELLQRNGITPLAPSSLGAAPGLASTPSSHHEAVAEEIASFESRLAAVRTSTAEYPWASGLS